MRAAFFALAGLCAAAAAPAYAGPGADLLRREMDAARSGEAEAALAALVQTRPRDQEAIYALGVAQIANAIETLAQGLHRLGYHGVSTGVMAGPLLNLPVPPNPEPEVADYPAIRALLEKFVADLDEARATLARVDSRSVKLRLDLTRLRLDLNGAGTADIAMGDVLAPPQPPADEIGAPARPETPPQRPRTEPRKAEPGAGPGKTLSPPPMTFAFDRADAIWLQGYAQLLAAPADFVLAHDFSTLTEATFHRLFARAGMALRNVRERESQQGGFVNAQFADAIAAVHFINWPVVAPERRARVRERLLAVSQLSRANWTAIRAERDNDREWLPNPRQTSPFPDLAITNERIDAWLAFLDVWDSVLNGEKLVPHWRFAQGMDMRAFFEGREQFDLVSILTGYGAAPYLKDGPIVSNAELMMLREQMGPNALLFAAWFN